MKKLLIPTLLVMLAACSGEKSSEQNTGRVKHAHISASAPSFDVRVAGAHPCLKEEEQKQPCAAVLLKDSAAIPKYPLSDIQDVMMVYVYDPAIHGGVGYDYRYNCNIVKSKSASDLCLIDAAEANKLLEPFLQ